MSVTVAKTAGFCFGVDRAVSILAKLANEGKKACTLGEIIHNPIVVKNFEQKGIRVINDVSEANLDETVVIRSHGVARSVYEYLEQKGIEYIDATCPYVKKIQKIVSEKSKEGYKVIITGDEKHPEVRGIVGHCEGECVVISDENDISKINFLKTEKIVLTSQTTFDIFKWNKCVEKLQLLYTNITIFDTICSATEKRQKEAELLSKNSDLMIVVGGNNSSNTKKLENICSKNCNTVLVEQASELDLSRYKNIHKVAITAGASTPAFIIKEVQTTMSEVLKNNLDGEDFDFAAALEESLKSIRTGDKVTGTVIGVTPTEVQVDLGTKHSGYVPLHELTDDPNAKTEDLVKKGDNIELKVLRVNDVEGTVMLSRKKIEAEAGFEKVCEAAEKDEVLTGIVTEIIKGGVIVLTKGVRVFVPASQAVLSKTDALEPLLKQKVDFKILEVNRGRRRAVGSIKVVAKEARKELEAKFWEDVSVDKTYSGVVKSITSYGVFVDLGGVDGMIHITELSWSRIKHPSEVVKVGDVLNVYVKDIDQENKKISLGYKKTEDNPWEILKRDYQVGQTVKATVASMTTFGAFATILPGVDGLIHVSQISKERVEKPQDVLKVGQVVEAKITELDLEKKRISLSMRALIEDKEPKAEPAPAEAPAEAVAETPAE